MAGGGGGESRSMGGTPWRPDRNRRARALSAWPTTPGCQPTERGREDSGTRGEHQAGRRLGQTRDCSAPRSRATPAPRAGHCRGAIRARTARRVTRQSQRPSSPRPNADATPGGLAWDDTERSTQESQRRDSTASIPVQEPLGPVRTTAQASVSRTGSSRGARGLWRTVSREAHQSPRGILVSLAGSLGLWAVRAVPIRSLLGVRWCPFPRRDQETASRAGSWTSLDGSVISSGSRDQTRPPKSNSPREAGSSIRARGRQDGSAKRRAHPRAARSTSPSNCATSDSNEMPGCRRHHDASC